VPRFENKSVEIFWIDDEAPVFVAGSEESGRPSDDAHTSESMYGAPVFVAAQDGMGDVNFVRLLFAYDDAMECGASGTAIEARRVVALRG
jgi:hypothetical protein